MTDQSEYINFVVTPSVLIKAQAEPLNADEMCTVRTGCPVSFVIYTCAHYIYRLALSNKPYCLLSGHFETYLS